MKTNIFDIVAKILLTKDKYVAEDGRLLKATVYTDIMTMDKELIELLINNEKIKNTFFIDINGTLVFDKQKFAWFIDSKEFLPDSFTSFTNKIGLAKDREYISSKNDVVLDFPYKDCVLEGGQEKDDQKRKEIFYHELIAQDEITRMLEPKVFTNAKRYTKYGIEKDIDLNDNDNLIIKGNNLIALATLLKRYQGKVKCIYIDPPYNTGNDSFGYNDNFNHSTWLTFMKNRLELAKKLLKEDGSIWINIDDDESHYLKVLCDEVFNRSNFIANIIWKKKYSPQNDARYFSDMHDHILVYSKNRELFKVKGLPRSEEMNSRYINMDNDPRGRWKTGDFSVRTYSKNNDYPIVTPSGKVINPPKGRCWRASEEKFNEMVKDNRIWFGKDGSNVPAVKRFLSEVKQSVTPQTIWDYSEVGHNQDARKEILGLKFKNTDFSTPKPEALLQRVINISSNKLDIILDFFMGSATTQSVALKMHRKFIGIEQMNYIEDIAVERLKKVIDGEQGGISKDEGWEGGESFVYCELKEVGNTLISDIENATEDTIKVLKEKLFSNESIVPYITTNELMEVERDFNNLTLKDKKKALALLVDKNKLYINYSDINDESLEITESERKFTKSFYEGNSND